MNTVNKWSQAATLKFDADTGQLLVSTNRGIDIKRAVINVSSNAAVGNILVSAVADKKICVLGLCLMAADSVNVQFYSGSADTGTAITGLLPIGPNGGFVLQPSSEPAMHGFGTVAGQELRLKLSAVVQCGGWLVYFEE